MLRSKSWAFLLESKTILRIFARTLSDRQLVQQRTLVIDENLFGLFGERLFQFA